MSSGLANQFDLKDEKQAKEYLDTLGVEYRFQCYHENLPEGCHRLADFLEAFKKDFEKARIVFQTNCDDHKYAHSCFKMGNYKMVGRACEKDPEEALKYYDQGCSLGYAPSCHNAALLHHLGKVNDKKDYVKARDFLRQGCDKDNVSSCQLLSTYYITGKDGVAKDMKKAFDYATKACSAGHIYACVNLSQMYRKGDGVAKDTTLADKFRKRAEQLHADQVVVEKPLTFGK